MNIQELNQQLSQLNTDYQLFQNDMANNKQFSSNTQTNNRGDTDNNFNIQNMNQKNGKDYESSRNDINERMNQFRHFDNDFLLRNQYQGETISNTNQNSNLNNYQELNNQYSFNDNNQYSLGNNNNNNNQNNENREDLRENMNNRMDNFIFDNPGNKLPSLVEIHQNNLEKNQNIGYNYKPVIQERSKSLYKSQTNNRLENYSPLT